MRKTPSYRKLLYLLIVVLMPALSWSQTVAKQTLGELIQLENQKLLNKTRAELQRQSEVLPQQLGLPIEVSPNSSAGNSVIVKKTPVWKVLGVYGWNEPLSVLLANGEKQHELVMGVKTMVGVDSIRVLRLEHQCVLVEINKRQHRFCLN